MSTLGQDHDSGSTVERYGDLDEATIQRHPHSDTDLHRYDDDDVKTAPWGPKLV
jgi:hypothetical protein